MIIYLSLLKFGLVLYVYWEETWGSGPFKKLRQIQGIGLLVHKAEVS